MNGRITLTDVMIGIDKHGLVCKLSDESFKFLIGMILEHNKIGFAPGFDMTNSQAMAAGGGNTPKSVRRRRLTLSKFKIHGKALLKFSTGNYGRNTCAKYEINYESILSHNGVWTKENDLPAQKRVGSGESRGRVEGTVGGTVEAPSLDQKREEKKEDVVPTPEEEKKARLCELLKLPVWDDRLKDAAADLGHKINEVYDCCCVYGDDNLILIKLMDYDIDDVMAVVRDKNTPGRNVQGAEWILEQMHVLESR